MGSPQPKRSPGNTATWCDRTMGIPLAEIKGFSVDEETAQAIADWHYWVARGRQF